MNKCGEYMNIKNYIYIVKNDLRCKPKYCFQMIKGIFFIMVILLISTLVILGVNSYYDNIIYGEANGNNITAFSFQLDENNLLTEDSKNVLDKVSEISQIETVSAFFDVLLPDKNGEYSLTEEDFENVVLTVGNKEYKEDISVPSKINPMSKNIGLKIQLCPENTDILPESVIKNFYYSYPNESLIVSGAQPKNEKEIMISEYLLNKFGINDYHSLIGKEIFVNVNGQAFLRGYKIAGVINSHLYDIEYYSFDPQIYVMKSEKNFKDFNLRQNGIFIACIGNPDLSIEVYETLEKNGLLESVLYSKDTAKVFAFAGKIRTAVKNIMACIIIFVLIGLIMSVYSIVNANINQSLSYYGMLQAMGMQKSSMLWIFILEQLFFIFVSAVISITAAGFLLVFINAGLNFVISEGLEISFLTYLFSSLSVLFLSGVIILLMEIVIFFISQRKDITEKLKHFKIY